MSRVAIVAGDFTLAGELDEGGDDAAIVCHPHPAFGGRMDNPLVVDIAAAIHAAGCTTLRFDFRGVGSSGGKPTGGLVEHEDVRAAVAFLRPRARRLTLVGYSFGALMAARALGDGEVADAFVAVAFPTSIIGDDPLRVGHVVAGLDRVRAALFIHGDEDSFCDVATVAAWAAPRPQVRVDVLAGRGHFFDDIDSHAVAAAVARFVHPP